MLEAGDRGLRPSAISRPGAHEGRSSGPSPALTWRSHPAAAAERGIEEGDWVRVETPVGSVRARARLDDTLKRDVICGQHGWWQACPEIDAPGDDAFGPDGANLNLVIGNDVIDPISGSVPHQAYPAEVHPLDPGR